MENSTSNKSALEYQYRILPDVSRTFALTIPALPAELRDVVANAYLLCRLADTIEDEPVLDSNSKTKFLEQFIGVLKHENDPDEFAHRIASQLSAETPDAERDLVANTAAVVRVTRQFTKPQQDALLRCVAIMCKDMPKFQRTKTLDGLEQLEDLDRYCYVVAGVVGEMLTELFAEHSKLVAKRKARMMPLAVSFGQGLQMTNILKDIWRDSESETCWLPRSFFTDIDGSLAQVLVERDGTRITDGVARLVGVAHVHLIDALRYTCNIPRREVGIRRFCLWAIGLAVLTLRNIYSNPGYTDGNQVKVSRRAVKATVFVCNIALYSNAGLKLLFALATRGLPQGSLDKAQPQSGPDQGHRTAESADLPGTLSSSAQ
jgi:farnesyl-diphosphate farnesyltransferase